MADDDTTYTKDDFEQAIKEERERLVANRDKALDQAKAHKRELDAMREKHEELEAKLSELENARNAKDAGVDEDELAKLTAKIEAAAERKWGKVADERDAALSQIQERDTKIRELMLDNRVKVAMTKAGLPADRADALFRLTSDRFELEDGEVIVKKYPEMEVQKYLSEHVANEYAYMWPGSGSSGGGASSSRAAGGAGGATRYIAADDETAFMDNVEAIAKGDVQVRQSA